MKNILFGIALFFLIAPTKAAAETFPTGSYIVSMGESSQTIGNALKPYGFVYEMLKTYNIPVRWVINPAKSRDGIDFTYNGKDFKGSAFIIPAGYIDAVINARITYWQGQGMVGVKTTTDFTVDIYAVLNAAPRWTLDKKNGDFAADWLAKAGIPASSYDYNEPALLDYCDDIFVLPHADPTWATHSNLLAFNTTNKGAIWSGCHAVSVLESLSNPANPSQRLNFLTTDGLVDYRDHNDATPPYSYAFPTDAPMQFLGSLDAATTKGSEQVFIPKTSSIWRSSSKIGVWDDTPPTSLGANTTTRKAAILAYGPGFGDPNNGQVMYEAGHDIATNNGTYQAPNIAAVRAFFNFSFNAAFDKTPVITGAAIPSNIFGQIPVPVAVTANSPELPNEVGLSYQWSSTCGGSFNNPNISNPVYTPPNLTAPTSCVITVKVTDACGRTRFQSTAVNLIPYNIALDASPVCVNNVPYMQYNVTADFDLTGYTATIEWSGSGTPQSIPNPLSVPQMGTIVRDNQPLSGLSIWPGMDTAAGGTPSDWPAWVFTGGKWVNQEDGYSSFLNGAGFKVIVSPAEQGLFSVAYPPSSPQCLTQPPVSVSGKIWDDANGSANGMFSNIASPGENGTNAGGLNVIITGPDPSNGSSIKVLGSAAVSAGGTYSLTSLLRGSNFSAYLSVTAGIIGSTTLPSAALPTGWTNTSPLTFTPLDASTNNVTNLDFGIDQLPTANPVAYGPVQNPDGTARLTVPLLSGTDPEDGAMGEGSRMVISTLPVNGTLYYNGIAVIAGQVLDPYKKDSLQLDPLLNGNTIVSFTYRVVDKAGKQSGGATVTMTLVLKPDLVVNLTSTPSILFGISQFNVLVDVIEVNNAATSGPVTVRIPKDSRISIIDVMPSALVGKVLVSAITWNYDPTDPVYHLFTTNDIIPALGKASFGFKASFDPKNNTGKFTLTATIPTGSGGETSPGNNSDAETLDYFIQ